MRRIAAGTSALNRVEDDVIAPGARIRSAGRHLLGWGVVHDLTFGFTPR